MSWSICFIIVIEIDFELLIRIESFGNRQSSVGTVHKLLDLKWPKTLRLTPTLTTQTPSHWPIPFSIIPSDTNTFPFDGDISTGLRLTMSNT